MTAQTCPRLDDAGSYLLRAMPDGEWEHYAEHLTSCGVCSAKVAELGVVSDALLNAVPQLNAPPEIRDRVMSVVRAESELLRAAGATADRPAEPAPRRFRLPDLRPWPAAVLATSLLALGIGGGALLVGGGDGDHETRTIACASAPGGASCEMQVAGDSAKLVLAGLQAPPEGRIYQIWVDRGEGRPPEPTEALFSVRKGRATVEVPGDLTGVKQVLVTHEPLGGSESPTRPPVIAAQMA
ncbi:MAG TPA: anti-sigma factor [Solirubrobacteraceae bacterium]|nr:anti-sigma factor [Solirubrobacteraceae bacterium]